MSGEKGLVLRGRRVFGGVAEGEALVTRQTISGWGGVDPMHGTIIETRHELKGQSFKDKILVFPGAKGSSGWSVAFHTARLAGTAPKAMIFNEMTTKAALGAVVMRIPSVTDLDRDPLDVAVQIRPRHEDEVHARRVEHVLQAFEHRRQERAPRRRRCQLVELVDDDDHLDGLHQAGSAEPATSSPSGVGLEQAEDPEEVVLDVGVGVRLVGLLDG